MKTYFKNHTIQKPNKPWKKLDELSYKELMDGFSENLNIKKKGIREKLLDLKRLRNRKEKEKYGSDDEEDEKEKERILADISEKHFKEWLKNEEQYPFEHNNFGKKQKKDIKGMIKKILLYGGLPTLLVVSLGVLSNKKINTGKVKKNIKVKANVQEKIFKKAFVSKLKEYYKTKRKEIKKMGKEEQKNLADTQKRKENRKIPTTSPRKSSSNPQQSSKTPPREKTTVEKINERRKQNIPSNKQFIYINNRQQEWSYEKEKDSNYYIKDGNIYSKNNRNPSRFYIYTEKDGLGKIIANNIVPFLKTEKLKKE